MKSKRISILQIVVAMILLSFATTIFSCTHNAPQPPPMPSLPDTVSFHKDIISLFQTYCNGSGCHSGNDAAGHLNLTDSFAYNQLFSKSDIDTTSPAQSFLYLQMNSAATPMPPTGRLSDYDVDLVLKWIQQGAKNN